MLDSNSASPATASPGTVGVRVESARNCGKRKQKKTYWVLETGTHCNWNVHYPIWRKMDGMGCVQRCRRLQLGEFHVSDGLEIDSCNDLIFRQSDQTIAGITTRVDIFGRLKADFLPFSSTKSFQHHSRLCSIRFFRHCSSQQLNTATVIIAATKNTSRCPAAGSSGTANTGPSVIFIPFRHAELGS